MSFPLRIEPQVRNRIRFLICVVTFLAIPMAGLRAQVELQSGGTWQGSIPAGQWVYFYVDVRDWDSTLLLNRGVLVGSGQPEVYVRHGSLPTATQYDH